MEELIAIVVLAWPPLVAIGGIIGGIVVFRRNRLTNRKLEIEIEKLKSEREEGRRMIIPSLEEIQRFGKSTGRWSRTVISTTTLAIGCYSLLLTFFLFEREVTSPSGRENSRPIQPNPTMPRPNSTETQSSPPGAGPIESQPTPSPQPPDPEDPDIRDLDLPTDVVNSEISQRGDEDIYRFHIPSERLVDIRTKTPDSNLDTVIELFSSGEIIAVDDDGGSGSDSHLRSSLAAGKYYVRVRAYRRGSGAYTFQFETATPLPIDVGSASTGELLMPGDVDTYSLRIINPGYYKVDLEADDRTLELKAILIRTADPREVLRPLRVKKGDEIGSLLAIPNPGTYFLEIRGPERPVGTYRVRIVELVEQR